MLPGDGHVHSEWSWDTGGPRSDAAGTMERTCERAVRIGLPALAFTEHLDFPEDWFAVPGDGLERFTDERGDVRVSLLDVDGYLACVERCRARFPDLRILTGVEFGQPHLHVQEAAALLDSGLIDRVNGSLHTLPHDGRRAEPATLFRLLPPERVIETYLAEVPAVVEGGRFDVFTHIDYAVRYWPEDAAPFDPRAFEAGFRAAMRAIAASGRALEMNTRRLQSWVPQWWAEEGGRAVTIASDAHVPSALATRFPETVVLLESLGFRPGAEPWDFWTR